MTVDESTMHLEGPSHYLLFWQVRSVIDHASNDLPLDVVASNQLMDVHPGDTIWIVTLTEERELVLAGRMVVGEIVEYEEAVRRMPDAGLWQAEYYAFPAPETEEYLRPIDIQDIAEEVRFEGEDDRLYVRDGKINPQQLQHMRKLSPETAGKFEERFYTFQVNGDDLPPEVRLNIIRATVEFDPDEPMHRYDLGVALGENGLHEEAIREYENALRLGHEQPAVVLYNIGCTQIELQNFEEAANAFNQVILAEYEFPPAHFMLGVALGELGRFANAIESTRKGLEFCDDPQAHYNIGRFNCLLGHYQAGLDELDLAGEPQDKTFFWKAKCHHGLGQIDDEIESFKKALEINPMFLDAMLHLGAAYEIKLSGSDEGVEYIDANDHLDLQDPRQMHYFEMAQRAMDLEKQN